MLLRSRGEKTRETCKSLSNHNHDIGSSFNDDIETALLVQQRGFAVTTSTMLTRVLGSRSALRVSAPLFRASYASTATTSNQVPANDPVSRDVKPNVSATNETPTSSEGSFDKVLQESVAKAEQLRTEQAPNYKGIWSRSQNPREVAMSGPRFEQSIMEDQVSLSAVGATTL